MATSGFCFVPSKPQSLLVPQKRSPRRFYSALNSSSAAVFSSSSAVSAAEKTVEHNGPIFCLSKRMLNLSIAAIFMSAPVSTISKAMAGELELERYTDSREGFTLLKPSSWIKVDKAGATVLFEEPNEAANNMGIVVNPVRIAKLEDFGSPQFVADKLIQAEKRKESTKDAEVIAVSERPGRGDLKVYEFEYKIDSTRGGMKRVFSAAFVASKKLYLLNIAHSDKPESPLDMYRRSILEQVLHSFDAAPLT